MLEIVTMVLREVLEIAIILGIINGALIRHAKSFSKYFYIGIFGGFLAAFMFAFFARAIMNVADGLGEEILKILIILFTVALIMFTILCMGSYTVNLKQNMSDIVNKMLQRRYHGLGLVLLVGGTIFRECTEIMVLLYSTFRTGLFTIEEYLTGISVGIVLGLIINYLIQSGFQGIPIRSVFRVSCIVLIMVAAGLASEAATVLTSTGMVSWGSEQIADLSWILPNTSILGKLMKITFGYTAKPNLLSIISYFGVIFTTLALNKVFNKRFI